MENQPRLPWFRLATMVRQQDNDSPPQPPLPPVRQPITPPPRATAPLAPPPTSLPRVTPPLVPQPMPQPAARPAFFRAIQQEAEKQVVETNNGSSRPATPPPPSPKVIKSSSSPTPPPSPEVVAPPLLPPVITGGNNSLTNNPEPEMLKMNRLQSIAMQEVEDKKDNGSNYNDNHINNNSNGKNSNGKNYSSNSSNGTHMRVKENERTNESRVSHPPSNHRKNEKDTKVVTIAGENVGAFMELGHSQGHNRKMHQGTGYSLTGELKKQEDQKGNEKSKNVGAKPITSLVNSNVQSINNSLMFNSSCSERSPGVHLSFKRKSKGKGVKTGSSSP